MDYGGKDTALPRYEEVVPDYNPSRMAQQTTTANSTTPSAPSQTPQPQGQNQPSILRSSSPPPYWTQRLRGGNGSLNRNVAPSAPAWGDHLPSVREEQAPTAPCSHPEPNTQIIESRLHSSLLYQIWRGFPVTPQKFSGDLQKAWGLGAGVVRRVLAIAAAGRSVYRWLIMQLVLACLALVFSMLPDQFFKFHPIQWLLTTAIVLSIVDLTLAIFFNHPNRRSRSFVIQFKTYFGLFRSCFYDLFLYPILILSIFQIIRNQSYLIFHGQGRNFDNEDTWEFAAFSVVASLYVMIVYIMRFAVFNSAVSKLLHNHTNVSGSRKTGSLFLKGFLFHVVVQVAIQIMLLIMISVRYQAEMTGNIFYRQENEGDSESVYDMDDGESISQFLKVMIAGGILIPMLSLPMYFVSTQKLVEEFFVRLFLDSPPEQRAISSISHIDTNTLKNLFSRFHKYNMSFVGGLLNILQLLFSPVQVVLCAVYTLLLLSFFVCFSYMSAVNEETGLVEIVNAFNTGLYSDVYSVPLSVTKGTFVVALLATVVVNIVPMFCGLVGAVLLPLHFTVGAVWLLVKAIRSRHYLSVQSV